MLEHPGSANRLHGAAEAVEVAEVAEAAAAAAGAAAAEAAEAAEVVEAAEAAEVADARLEGFPITWACRLAQSQQICGVGASNGPILPLPNRKRFF